MKNYIFILNKIINKFNILHERLRNIDFSLITPVDELSLNSNKVYHGSSSHGKKLRNVFKVLNIKSADSILDIGCAKGGAMYEMYSFPFKRIDGIEISNFLTCIAKKNIQTLKMSKSTIYNIDAQSFNSYDLYNYFYLYNPFDKETFDNVIKLIINKNKNFIMIYNNPKFHNLLINFGFKVLHDMPGRYEHRIFIYEYKKL
jgi:hypothetical protein